MSTFTDRIKAMLSSAADTAQSVVKSASGAAKNVFNRVTGNESSSTPSYLGRAADRALQSGGNLSDKTKALLGTVSSSASSGKKTSFLSALQSNPNISEKSKKVLSALQAKDSTGVRPVLQKTSYLDSLQSIPNLSEKSKTILSAIKGYQPKTAGEKAAGFAKDVVTLKPVREAVGTVYGAVTPSEEQKREVGKIGTTLKGWAEDQQIKNEALATKNGGVAGVINRAAGGAVLTPIQMIGSAIESYGEGAKLKPIVELGLGALGVTGEGALFNAVFNQPGIRDAAAWIGEKAQEGADATKSFIGLDSAKHPELSYAIDTAFQFLPYILAGAAVKKGGGALTKDALIEKLKDPTYQIKVNDLSKKIVNEAKKGDFSRLEKIATPEQIAEVKKVLGLDEVASTESTRAQKNSAPSQEVTLAEAPKVEGGQAGKEFKPTPSPEVSDKAVPKSIKDLPTTEEAKRFILTEGEKLSKTPEGKRITEKVSFDQMKTEADALGFNLADFQKFADSSTKNRGVVVSAMGTTAKIAETLKMKVQEFSSKNRDFSPAEREAALGEINSLQAEYDAHYMATREILAEAGRQLVASKVLSKMKGELEVMKENGGRLLDEADVRSYAEAFARGETSGSVFGAKRGGILDAISEVRTGGLVSDPRTHWANIASNLSRNLVAIPEKALAASIEIPKSILMGRPREVFFKEMVYQADGLTRGTVKGLGEAIKILLGKEGTGETAKFQNALGGPVGKVVRTPFKLLQAEDAIFKGMIEQTELSTQALRAAKAEGLSGAKLSLRVKELKENPTAAMKEKIKLGMDKGTFQEKVGEVAEFFNSARRNKNPWFRFLAKTFLPFVQTPASTLKQAFMERTPLGLVSKGFWKEIKKGGAESSEAMARMTFGTAVTALGIDYALSGGVSGAGPTNQNEKNLLYSQGWQPYSIKVGDRWFSYKRVWPLNILFGVPATMMERYDEVKDEELMAQVAGLSQTFATVALDQTFLTGLSDLIGWLNGDYRSGEFGAQTAVSFTPFSGAMRFLRDTNDKYLREAGTTLENFKNLFPGLSDDLPAQVDYWGNPIEKSSTVPGTSSLAIGPSSVEKEFEDLQYFPGVPEGKISEWSLSAEEYNKFLTYAGKIKEQFLPQVLETEDYKNGTKQEKRDILEKEIKAMHSYIRETYGAQLISEQLGAKSSTDPEQVMNLYKYLRENIYGFDDLPQSKKEETMLEWMEQNNM